MNSPLETGLFLPIRFYETLAEQDRFKRISEGVSLIDEVYVYADCKTLLPFQIVTAYTLGYSFKWYIVCLDTENISEMVVDYDYWEGWSTADNLWISYLGNQDLSAYTSNGRHYIQVDFKDNNNVVKSFYSDIFVIRNCNNYYEDNNYRITSSSNSDRRLIDVTDLRITTNI